MSQGGRKRRGRGLPLVKLRPGFLGGRCSPKWQEKKFKKKIHVAAVSRDSRNSIRITPAASLKIPDGRPHETAKPLPVFYLWSDFNLDSHQSNQSIFFFPPYPPPFCPLSRNIWTHLANQHTLHPCNSFLFFFLLQKEPPPPPASPPPTQINIGS